MDVPGLSSGGDGGDILSRPLYSSPDVAHLLHVHPDTLRYWVLGKTYPVAGGEERTAPPLVGDGSGLLSFQDLAELAVVAHLRHLGFRLSALRNVAEGIKAATGSPRPFLNQLLAGGGTEIALDVDKGKPISMTYPGQRVLPLPVDDIFQRIEVKPGNLVVRVRPFSRPEDPYHDPARIEIDPRRRFGRPITRPNGLDVAAIWDRRQWGETTDEPREDLDAEPEEIEEAIRYHERYLEAA